MITYGSYFTDDNNLLHTSANVALSDTIVSILAGMAIFPVVFTFGLAPSSGPGLLFNTIPLVFSKMPFGNILLVAFFILAGIAATTASLSMVQVPVAFISEKWNIPRKYAVLSVTTTMFIIGALTTHPSSMFGSIRILGKNFFDFFDFTSSNIMMPIGGLLISIFVGYFVNKDDLIYELSNKNTLNNSSILKLYHFILKYISPILLIIVFLNSIGII
jgi:NSS family neurotransmitter:Na+ symporter